MGQGNEAPAEARLRRLLEELIEAEAVVRRLPPDSLSAREAGVRVDAARMAYEAELQRQRMRQPVT